MVAFTLSALKVSSFLLSIDLSRLVISKDLNSDFTETSPNLYFGPSLTVNTILKLSFTGLCSAVLFTTLKSA